MTAPQITVGEFLGHLAKQLEAWRNPETCLPPLMPLNPFSLGVLANSCNSYATVANLEASVNRADIRKLEAAASRAAIAPATAPPKKKTRRAY